MEENTSQEKPPKRKVPTWLTTVTPLSKTIALILFIALPFIGFCLGYKYSQKVNVAETKIVYQLQPSSEEVKKEVVDENSLRYILANNCVLDKNGKGVVSLDKLPVELGAAIKAKFDVSETLPCSFIDKKGSDSSFVNLYADSTPETIYIFHDNSIWIGQGDQLKSLENYKKIVVNGKTYWVDFPPVDAVGYSSDYVSAEVIGEKEDQKTGTRVRIAKKQDLKNLEFVQALIKKYGVEYKTDNGNLISYSVTNYKDFVNELSSQSIENNIFDQTAKEVQQDLDGITFK